MNFFKLTALLIIAVVSWITLQTQASILDFHIILTYSLIFLALTLLHSNKNTNVLLLLVLAVKSHFTSSSFDAGKIQLAGTVRRISYISVVVYAAYLLAISDLIYQQCQTIEATALVMLKAVGVAALLSLFISEILLTSIPRQQEA